MDGQAIHRNGLRSSGAASGSWSLPSGWDGRSMATSWSSTAPTMNVRAAPPHSHPQRQDANALGQSYSPLLSNLCQRVMASTRCIQLAMLAAAALLAAEAWGVCNALATRAACPSPGVACELSSTLAMPCVEARTPLLLPEERPKRYSDAPDRMSYQWGWAACSLSRGCTWVYEIKGKLRCAKADSHERQQGATRLPLPLSVIHSRSSNARGRLVGERIISRLSSPALRAYTTQDA